MEENICAIPCIKETSSCYFSVFGDLNFQNIPFLATEGAFFIEKASSQSVCFFDFQAVESGNSAAFALLLHWYRLAKKRSTQIKILNPPEFLLKLISVMGLSKVLEDMMEPQYAGF